MRSGATEGSHGTVAPAITVLGAGTMGRGIAQLALQAGCAVTLIDANPAAVAGAVTSLAELFASLAAKGRLAQEPDDLMARLTTGSDLPTATSATETETAAAETSTVPAAWIIEAVPEDLELKRRVFQQVAESAPTARLASNTSTLSVTAIAAGCSRPSDVVGMHFFNPPGLMRLVEVVPGAATRPSLVDEAVALARLLGREPVVANDSPGFIVNRLARPYYLEALRLHAEGLPVEDCDATMRAAGFRMGPFELLDLIGIDVNLAASINVYRGFFEEPRYRPHPLQQRMVAAGWLGRKTGRGFYRYDAEGRKLSAAVSTKAEGARGAATGAHGAATGAHDTAEQAEASQPESVAPDQLAGVALRIVVLLANEAIGALAEGLASRESIDTAMRLGVNYPLGPLEWAERLGLARVLATLEALQRETGAERFAPHPLLRRAVTQGLESFVSLPAHDSAPTTSLSDTMRR